jgi:murein peptide amidase A
MTRPKPAAASTVTIPRRRIVGGAAAALLLAAATPALAVQGPGPVPGQGAVQTYRPPFPAHPAAVERRVIGYSVDHRPIVAWRLGETGTGVRTVLLMSTIHGNERLVHNIEDGLLDGRPIRGVDLWVIPVANPDGYARDTRKNAHDVDLNRNFPTGWVPTSGYYYGGPSAASEPETRALMRFLTRIHPWRILSFHQPLDAVDTDTKDPAYSRRVGRALGLPVKRVRCAGVCGGTLTQWYNAHFPGLALTVEYPAAPSVARMRSAAPAQLLRLFGGRRQRAGSDR